MDEALVRGLIIGAVLGAIAVVISLIKKLIKSPTEVARRLRVVAVISLALGVGTFALEMFGLASTVITAVIVGAVFWVYTGKGK